MAYPPYEFTSEENTICSKLAKYMKYTGLLFIFLGVLIGIFCGLTIVKSPYHGIAYLLQTILVVTIGVWTNSASYSFRLIVETAGNDMDNLMDALNTMRRLYTIQFFLSIVAVFATLAVLIMSMVLSYTTMIK
jgi:hypothetical protein